MKSALCRFLGAAEYGTDRRVAGEWGLSQSEGESR